MIKIRVCTRYNLVKPISKKLEKDLDFETVHRTICKHLELNSGFKIKTDKNKILTNQKSCKIIFIYCIFLSLSIFSNTNSFFSFKTPPSNES